MVLTPHKAFAGIFDQHFFFFNLPFILDTAPLNPPSFAWINSAFMWRRNNWKTILPSGKNAHECPLQDGATILKVWEICGTRCWTDVLLWRCQQKSSFYDNCIWKSKICSPKFTVSCFKVGIKKSVCIRRELFDQCITIWGFLLVMSCLCLFVNAYCNFIDTYRMYM